MGQSMITSISRKTNHQKKMMSKAHRLLSFLRECSNRTRCNKVSQTYSKDKRKERGIGKRYSPSPGMLDVGKVVQGRNKSNDMIGI